MRRPILQSCSLVLLLVARLFFGEAAHAMPHQMLLQGIATAAEQLCPEHSKTDHAGHQNLSSDTSGNVGGMDGELAVTDAAQSGDPDCCDGDDCEGLCVHGFVATTPTLNVNLIPAAHASVPSLTFGLIQDRLSVLFRPPA